MSANRETSPASTPRAPAKPRNPIERLVVWGGILILLLLVGIEYATSRAQAAAAANLTAKMRASETAGVDVKAADVKAAVNGKTPRVLDVSDKQLRSGAKRVEVYHWFTLSPLKSREIYVYYGVGEDPDVLSVTMEEDTETVGPLSELIPEQVKDLKVFEDGLKKMGDSNAAGEAEAEENSEPGETSPAKE